MKIPYPAGESLSEFVKSAKLVSTCESSDGSKLNVYGAEVLAPNFCLGANCGSEGKLRRNGSYTRQVIEGLMMVLVLIYRFRCGLCGKTVSRPYSFLVPYRRFTAKLIAEGIEMYGGDEQATYDELSTALSVFSEGVEQEAGVQNEETQPTVCGKGGFCPARSTSFSWVDFFCKRMERMVQQVEKELVLRGIDLAGLPGESEFFNANAWKAGRERYAKQKDKPEQLNKLSYGLAVARLFFGDGPSVLEKLRAYFLQFAERCADLLSDVTLVLPITQTSEQPIW